MELVLTNQLETVFKMFVKLNTNSVGPGLGLYIVKEIVKKLSGSVSLSSFLGQGTKVKVIIPI